MQTGPHRHKLIGAASRIDTIIWKVLVSPVVHPILHTGRGARMPRTLPPPLGGPAPTEVPLSRSPLVGVVMQARFSSVLKIDSKDGVAPFQEELRNEYPLLEQAVTQQLQIDLGGG